MTEIREFCDVCHVEFHEKRDKHGLVVVVGHSPNGWGSRRNLLNHSSEVCEDCYQALGVNVTTVWERWRADRAALRTVRGDAANVPRAQVVTLPVKWWNRALFWLHKL